MSDTKLRAKLPEGDANGLKGDEWRKRLLDQPRKPRVAIVVFDVDSITKTLDDNLEVPAVRLLALEPTTDPVTETMLLGMLQRSAAARSNDTVLDFDFPGTEEPDQVWTDPEHFEIRLLPGGRVGLYLVNSAGEVLSKGGTVKTSEWPDVVPGVYQFAELAPAIRRVADLLLAEAHPERVPVFDEDDAGDFEPGDAGDFNGGDS